MLENKTSRFSRKAGLYLLLLIGIVISIFPFYWMLVGATNHTSKMFSNPPTLWFGDQFLTNFTNLNNSINIWRVLFNSVFVSGVYVILALMVSTMAAYALAKFHFKGNKFIFTTFLLSMMIPYQALLIPQFRMMADYGLLNTYIALILPTVCTPFAIFLMRQNFMAFPTELIEAARMDGAGEMKIFFQIVIPSMKPALAATSIFLFLSQWNNFLWPLVVTTTTDMYTFPVALSSLKGVSIIDYGQINVGILIATIPIIIFFLALQKHFIQGMLGSAIK
ncbi:carbohydrate ABC transporter permease [Bacillus sp. REN16]|uniref:carbohydrate ABC transporter permease n=1 Tax=Bacillus sp. REN16 TaxID=2887296 RepID=UPI001E5F4761|nr:carbohydrate ABC transporter permease [Bacillus sp. REN16]MCC3356961.1 carbohydrate ABC transporter permease [Bacillus sp. REN16]